MKYRNKPTVVDGYNFASKLEAARYQVLKERFIQGRILGLQVHPSYVIQESFVDGWGKRHRAITYIADFSYVEDMQVVVEDTKGVETDVFKIKQKLFLHRHRNVCFRIVKKAAE